MAQPSSPGTNPTWPPTREAALARLLAVQPHEYARTRNALDGAVTGLSPYITHGLLSLPEVLASVCARHRLSVQHKFVYELGWRAYFQHVWQQRGQGIFRSLHPGPLPDEAYTRELPPDVREARTGLPVIDQAVRTLYATGYLHNHARMWLASYLVHLRKCHWRAGADWLYAHLLDGDLASNHLSWQWVAGTGSHKPYLFNAENVARYAPPHWHSPGSVLDTGYEALERLARDASGIAAHATTTGQACVGPADASSGGLSGLSSSAHAAEPACSPLPPLPLACTAPDPQVVAGRDVWLVHPWSLGTLPSHLPPGTLVLGVLLTDFHHAWPWSQRRWQFVAARLATLAPVRWHGDAHSLQLALAAARSVRGQATPHLAPWLGQLLTVPEPTLFRPVQAACASFSRWWSLATRGVQQADELLQTQEVLPW